VKLYYFSGTGNSLYVAQKVSESFPGSTMIPVLRFLGNPETAITGDLVGIVFPIYMNAVPGPVRRFLENRDFSGVQYLFAVSTHGGYPGKVGGCINDILAPRGRLLDGYFTIEMINNTPKGLAPRFLMRLDWENSITPVRVADMTSRLESELARITDAVRNRNTEFSAMYESSRKARGGIVSRYIWRTASRSHQELRFIRDDSCTGCGNCEKVCLSTRIRMVDGFPHWRREIPCFYCYACFNYCPEQAIGVKHYTTKAGRYHFPGIGPDLIAAQKPEIMNP
jgi:NAD-dependent dihydropyrimidine dehydrogenase PreA subunit